MSRSGEGFQALQAKDNMKNMNNMRGFSLVELVTVVAILVILMSIGGFFGTQWVDRYNAESQIRKMHADLLQTRANAMATSKPYSVVVNNNGYRIGVTDDSGVTTWQNPVTLKYTISAGTGTLTFDTRGLVSSLTSTALSILFDTRSGSPEYDCLSLCATRINVGRKNGTNCVPR